MKYRHRSTDETIEVTTHAGPDGVVSIPGGQMWLGTGDLLVKRESGEYEGYQPSHPFWDDYDEIVETRVISVNTGKKAAYHAERLTPAGWVRGAGMATLAEAEADRPSKPVETVVKEFTDGVATAELVAGDDPATATVETSWWRKVISFMGLDSAQ